MGAVSVLLMMAIAGVTYGWQPDNDGGVEYIIQVPPDQLAELRRVGEITSAIDPAVQGHVSRVIIRVGDETLPRVAPSNLGRVAKLRSDSDETVYSDQSPVPMPELNDDGPSGIASATVTKNRPEALMKPQTGGPSSPGFQYPTAANAGQSNASSGANSVGSFPRIPPPATRTPPPSQRPPEFTGGVGTARPGGPSTDPAPSRDTAWRNLSSQGFAGANPNAPSTEPAGPSGMSAGAQGDLRTNGQTDDPLTRSRNPFTRPTGSTATSASSLGNPPSTNPLAGPSNPLAPANPLAGSSAANPQTSTGSFGRPPSSLSLPTNTDPRASASSNGLRTYPSQPTDRADGSSSSTFPNSNYGNFAGGGNSTTGYSSSADRGQADPRLPTASGSLANPNDSFAATPSTPDRRLTQAEIRAGAWSLDANNQLLDRNGRLLAPLNTATNNLGYDANGYPLNGPQRTVPTSMPDPRRDSLGYSDQFASSLGQPRPSTPSDYGRVMPIDSAASRPPEFTSQRTFDAGRATANTGYRSDDRRSREPVDAGRPDNSQSPTTLARQSDPPSLANRSTASVVSPRQVAAQPFFNGLLLISFVANVYLLFWMKNLHQKYREMVAAKRIANSNPVG